MKAILLLVLAAFLAVASAGATYTDTISANGLSFAADVNVTVDEGDDRFSYRKSLLVNVPLVNKAFYYSTAVDVEHSGSSVSGEVDCIFAYATAPSDFDFDFTNYPPGVVMAYLSAEGSANQEDLSSTFTASGSALATVYTKLEEVKSNGQVVRTINLKDLDFSSSHSTSDENPEIQYVTYSADISGGDSGITITMVVSSVTGILNVGGAPITPKSAEIILEIEYDDYSNAGNHLRLTVFTATASAIAEISASSNTMISGSGATQVYVHFNGEAVVDGEVASVTVSGVADSNTGDADDLDIFEAFVTANGELHFDIRKVVVDFPAGAASISYDPSMGFDAPKVYAAAGTLSVPAALIFTISAILLFFF